jgi:hypothetical protein
MRRSNAAADTRREGGMTDTLCEGCGQHSFLIPLHGGKGGPLRCPLCVGAWNAEHGRKRRTGRIVMRAMMAFLDAGGKSADLDKLKITAVCGDLIEIDPLGYMADIARIDGADVDLASELLADVLQLTHPDHQPPERQQLAHAVTQRLLALLPFVFPAPEPEPEPEESEPTSEPSTTKAHRTPKLESPPSRYPCADCADAASFDYCDHAGPSGRSASTKSTSARRRSNANGMPDGRRCGRRRSRPRAPRDLGPRGNRWSRLIKSQVRT